MFQFPKNLISKALFIPMITMSIFPYGFSTPNESIIIETSENKTEEQLSGDVVSGEITIENTEYIEFGSSSDSTDGSLMEINTKEEEIILNNFNTGSIEYSPTNSGAVVTVTENIVQKDIPKIINTIKVERIIEKQNQKEYKQGEVIVQFKDQYLNLDTTLGKYQAKNIVQNAGYTLAEILPEGNMVVITNKDATILEQSIKNPEELFVQKETLTTEDLIHVYENDPRVESVQPNYKYTLQSLNDPWLGSQWGLNNIGQSINGTNGTIDADIDYPEAMTLMSGSIQSTGVIVAVLDSGTNYNHPDLRNNMWNGTDCVSYTGANLADCVHGYDFYGDDLDSFDDHITTHGTMVASIIGGETNNGTGMVGIVPNVTIMSVRVCGAVGCFTSDIIKGIQFAKNNGAKVINASFGAIRAMSGVSDYDWAYHDAIADFPGIFVTAASNDTLDNNTNYVFPSAFGQSLYLSGEIGSGSGIVYSGNVLIPALDNIISVAATDENDELAYFSNYGSDSVDIGAPGTNILGATGGTIVTNTGEISSTGGWTKNTSDVYLWMNQYNASGSFVGVWGDGRSPYNSGSTVSISKTYQFSSYTQKTVGISIWCDTPSATGYTDYMKVEYSVGGDPYKTIGLIDEDTLALYGSQLLDGTHTGATDSQFFTFAGSGNIDLRMSWITDDIDQLDESGNAHYGCYIFHNTLEIEDNRGTDGGYTYGDGTSFAAPHVAGALALGMTYNSNISPLQMKKIVLETGDTVPGLIGKTRTGKRLNIANMIQAMQANRIVGLTDTLIDYKTISINYILSKVASGALIYAKDLASISTGSGTKITFNNNQTGSFSIGDLDAASTYFYRLELDDPYASGTISSIQNFITPTIIEYDTSANTVNSSRIYLSGSSVMGISYPTTGSGVLTLTNTGNTVHLDIPLSGATIIPNQTPWNGIIDPIVEKMMNGIIHLPNGVQISVRNIYGITSGSGYILTSSTGTLTISLPGNNGANIAIYGSQDGSIYTRIGTCLVTNNNCTLSVNTIGNWAIGYPVYPIATQTSGGGGGGGGGSSVSSSIGVSPFIYASKNTIETLLNLSTTIPKIRVRITSESRKLNINIRTLRAKIDKKSTKAIDRYNLIVSLQKLYRNQIELMRAAAKK